MVPILLGLMADMGMRGLTVSWIEPWLILNFFYFCNLVSCSVLPRSHSDHSPLFIHCGWQDRLVLRFRFQAMWISHPDIQGVISKS